MASLLQRSPARVPVSTRRALLALGGGNAVEWYDWMVYGLLASSIGPQFFPSSNPLSSTMSALAVFAVGFAARPLGAVVFGRIADRAGRKGVMLFSIGSMVATSLVITVTPTHAAIGTWAGVILLLCRIVQGVSTGIEAPLNSTYAVELAPEGHTARFGAIMGFYVQVGIVGASLVCFGVSSVMSQDALDSWGWRIPFAIGALAGGVFLWLRRALPETLESTADATDDTGDAALAGPWAELARRKLALLTIVFVVAGAQAINYTWTTGLPNLARTTHHEDSSAVFAITTLSGVLVGCLYPLVGRIADRSRISRTFWISRLGTAALVFIVLVYQGPGLTRFTVVMLVGAPVLAFTMGLYNTVAATLMPMHCRVTGVGIGYAVGVAGFGGTAPYVLLWFQNHGAAAAFPVYVAVLCLLSVLLYRLAFARGAVRAGD
ncbi:MULTISPECIES: MFS transporter [unclassified Streptomyces]|uniref:MFS transporter n=1 Tax=unclassified Streptomyces TaxID=2593676 RepID=UPI002E180DD7